MRHCLPFILYHIWLFRKRNILITIIQFVGPILVILLFTWNAHFLYESESPLETNANNTIYRRIKEQELYASIPDTGCEYPPNIITYTSAPQDADFAELMINEMQSTWIKSSKDNLTFVRVQNEIDLTKFAVMYHANYTDECYIGGIVFLNSPFSNNERRNTKLRVKLRMASFMPVKQISVLTHALYFDSKYKRDYIPYLALQLSIYRSFIGLAERFPRANRAHKRLDNQNEMQFSVEPFHYKNIQRHLGISADVQPVYAIVAITLVFSQVFMVLSIVRGPAYDKDTGFRAYLKIKGLKSSVYWASWWQNECILRLVVCIVQVTLLFTDLSKEKIALVQRGNYFIWYIFLMLYTMASISFFIFIASFCKRGAIAPYVAATIWFLSFYFGEMFLSSPYLYSHYTISKLFMCLNPNAAIILGCSAMTKISGGIQWKNLFSNGVDDEIMLAQISLVLIVDIILYFLLTLYADMLRPGLYSVKFWQHCCSSLKARFAFCMKRRQTIQRLFQVELSGTSITDKLNEIVFSDVTVAFRKQETVLNNVSFQILEKRTTAIVGPVGSGKTVITKLIAGFYPPNSGTVMVSGHNATTEKHQTRNILTLCPDQNLLCRYITVMEHLILVGYANGHQLSYVRHRARVVLDGLELLKHANDFPDDLVHIQKRKLCIAMTLIGKNQVTVLDDPMNGMDQDERNQTWKFIKEYCRHRTILLLTPNLSEAYSVADRIAFLTNGRLLGTSTKGQLESSLSYHLHLKLDPEVSSYEVITYVRKLLPLSEKLERHSMRFQLAFEEIEKHMNESRSTMLSTKSSPSKESSGADVYYDAVSKVATSNETDFPDFDYYELENPGATKNALFMFLPKSSIKQLSNFFKELENEKVRNENGIVDYHLYPYDIEAAYRELEEYMRLREATEILTIAEQKLSDVSEVITRKSQSKKILEDPLSDRVKILWFQQFWSQIIKRFAFVGSVWLHVVFQFLVPVLLVLGVIGATNISFETNLDGTIIDDSLSRFLKPTVLTKKQNRSRFYNSYILKVAPALVEEVESFQDKLDSLGSSADLLLSSVYVLGAEFQVNESTALFSPIAFHTAPISIDLLLNTFVDWLYIDYSVDIVAHPITTEPDILKFYLPEVYGFDWNPASSLAIIVCLGFFCCTSFFIIQPLTEKNLRLKRLQLNTGLSPFTYWFTLYIFDTVFLMIFAVVVTIIFYYAPAHAAFRNLDFSFTCFVFFTIAGISSLTTAYAMSFVFMQPKSCYFAMVSANEVVGLFLFVATTFFDKLPGFIVSTICRLFQPFNVISGMYNLFNLGIHNSRCQLMDDLVRDAVCDLNWRKNYSFPEMDVDQSCCDVTSENPSDWMYYKHYWNYKDVKKEEFYRGFMFDVICLVLHVIIFVVGVIFREMGWHRKYFVFLGENPRLSMQEITAQHEDTKEISLDPVNRNHFSVYKVTKQFFMQSGKVLHRVSFSAAPGELVSIVGPLKSAKTVLLHILTGFLTETSGNFFFGIPNQKSATNGINYLKYVGFAPSHNIFEDIPHMKGVSLLKLFARLRGIPEKDVKRHVTKWKELLGLQNILNTKSEYLTLSSKKKIMLAMAFIGDPPMLIFDEPFEGLDPYSKRQFWIITEYLRTTLRRIVIVATPSVKDVESRSSKIMFLVNGEVQCYMTPAALRKEHRRGYLLHLKFRDSVSFDDWSAVQNRISSDFPTSRLESQTINSLDYKLDHPKDSDLVLSQIFEVCQKISEDHPNELQEYYVGEQTLQHIYDTYASRQQPYNKPISAQEEFCMHYF